MPKDKTANHEKIVEAAMEEFLTKGYERSSMKSIADSVGMTSAGLYRHFADKQAMFAAMVQPALDALDKWQTEHSKQTYNAIDRAEYEEVFDGKSEIGDMTLVIDVMYEQPEAFYLLLKCSVGTPFENTVHDLIEVETDRMMDFADICRKKGFAVHDIQRDEMHMLVSAYTEALLQPIEHRYTKEDAERYLKTIVDFFMHGWRKIFGF